MEYDNMKELANATYNHCYKLLGYDDPMAERDIRKTHHINDDYDITFFAFYGNDKVVQDGELFVVQTKADNKRYYIDSCNAQFCGKNEKPYLMEYDDENILGDCMEVIDMYTSGYGPHTIDMVIAAIKTAIKTINKYEERY